jgi:4-coumarate--CoA ligase
MIKVKGIQVAPAELEDLLQGHPKIEDCAVIGIPDDYSGERPFGFVVLKPGIKPTEEVIDEIVGYVKGKKVRTKWLHGVEIIDQIPKSASGKILRRVLREKFKSETAGSRPKL